MLLRKFDNPFCGKISVFDDLFRSFGFDDEIKYNLIQKENEYQLEFNVAGFKKENFKIDVEDNQLKVIYDDNKSKECSKENYIFKSFSNNSFVKIFDLSDIDSTNIKAKHEDGILKITLPKSKETLSRKIEIE